MLLLNRQHAASITPNQKIGGQSTFANGAKVIRPRLFRAEPGAALLRRTALYVAS
jgi:hypothetical protein